MHMRIYLLLFIFCIFQNGWAGGSHIEVDLLQFTTHEKGYLLIVSPPPDSYSYMKGCSIFTVIGSYNPQTTFIKKLIGTANSSSKKDHIQAIQFL